MGQIRHFDHAEWHASTLCQNATCVEVALGPDLVGIRDGKDRSGPILAFGAEEWHAFIEGVRRGEFDVPG
jgi:hypothetical protein